MTHTETPWLVCRESDELGTIGTPILRIIDENGDDSDIVIGRLSDFGPNDVKADTQFILAAVNSHDALVEACVAMKERITLLHEGDGHHWEEWHGAEQVDALLAKAKPQEDGKSVSMENGNTIRFFKSANPPTESSDPDGENIRCFD